MDAESNYESDISESWSLIDINLNEESLITTDASTTLEKSHSPPLKNIKSEIKNKTGSQDCVENYNDQLDCIELHDSDSVFKNHNLKPYSVTNVVQPLDDNYNGDDDDDDDDERNDSGDTDSIEILDRNTDGSYQDSEIDKLDVSFSDDFNLSSYQSDDEESLEEEVQHENRSNSSTVIKRKSGRACENLEDIVHSVYSENASVNDTVGLSKKLDKGKNHPVYKHYRNNVANTVLSLSVRVIFAGVACIAIGHFLGVQDAAETAVELVETLKKLQVENAELQSSMVHLQKALHTLETNSKSELPLNQPHNNVQCSPSNVVRTQTNLNNAALSEIFSSLNSIEWLFKRQNVVKKGTEIDNKNIDMKTLGKHIHDQLNLLREEKTEAGKLSEGTDLLLMLKKLLVELKKVMNGLSSSHDNIEGIHKRLIKLNRSLTHSLKKISGDSSNVLQSENRIPITQLDLKTVRCCPSSHKIQSSVENPESGVLYKFPQPRKYYELQSQLNLKDSNNSLKNENYKIESSNKGKSKESKEKKHEKKWKKGKEIKDRRKKDKKQKRSTKKFGRKESGYIKQASSLRSFNESSFLYKKNQENDVKYKRRVKKIKNSKLEKIILPKVKKDSDSSNKYDPFCSESGCFNLTGYWVFKWADGRKKFRRHESLADWQFERAKARGDVRDVQVSNNWQFERAKARGDVRDVQVNKNWQFERAKARKEMRNEPFNGNRQPKKSLKRDNKRNNYHASQEKFTKNYMKHLFQEWLSWM